VRPRWPAAAAAAARRPIWIGWRPLVGRHTASGASCRVVARRRLACRTPPPATRLEPAAHRACRASRLPRIAPGRVCANACYDFALQSPC